MDTSPVSEDRSVTTVANSSREPEFGVHRRKLFKRLVLLAAAGYIAPKAIMISEAWACHKVDGGGTGVPHGNVSVCP